MEMDFLLSLLLPRANDVLVETIMQIKYKPFFIKYPLSYNFETIFYELF